MSKSKAEAILREFYEDVLAAHGTGEDDKIDEESLNWPDLAATYKKASVYFSKHPDPKSKSQLMAEAAMLIHIPVKGRVPKSKSQLLIDAAMKSPGSIGEATENGFKRSFR